MKTLSRDARGFIDGVTQYLRSDARGKEVLPKVQTLFSRVTTAAKKERTASVATSIGLTESEKKAVSDMLAHILGHEVECRFVQDNAVLGGMKVTVADWVVDTSLASQLTSMAESLL